MMQPEEMKTEPENSPTYSSEWSDKEEEHQAYYHRRYTKKATWMETTGEPINRYEGEEWKDKERWSLRDMKSLVDGTPTLVIWRPADSEEEEKPRRAVRTTTIRPKREAGASKAEDKQEQLRINLPMIRTTKSIAVKTLWWNEDAKELRKEGKPWPPREVLGEQTLEAAGATYGGGHYHEEMGEEGAEQIIQATPPKLEALNYYCNHLCFSSSCNGDNR